MRPRFVKICGVRDPIEAEMVSRYADATGVIVGCDSRREVSIADARRIMGSSKVPVYLVSTKEDYGSWSAMIEGTCAEYIQVHSTKMRARDLARLRDEYGVHAMMAFKVPLSSTDPAEDARKLLDEMEGYDVDKVLLDTGAGTGRLHDLDVSKIIASEREIVLAGGICPSNVKEVVSKVSPYGIDVSSGVETDGRKSEEMMSRLCLELYEDAEVSK
ncbi:MAG: phosphoribosylanthranilate isomerase [Candidatus Methanofastidiosa archaeon]|nr:phosphoribosylanthranilate isomerase [Candidatus Methanofastidiosa archaeon]